jgi:hypothetical protein
MSFEGDEPVGTNTLSTKDKYHLFLIYVRDKDGHCGGGYHDISLKFGGGVGGNSFEEMCDEAYESLEDAMLGEINIPFDMNNIKGSVEFDLVECQDIEELEMISDLAFAGKTFNELKNIINE